MFSYLFSFNGRINRAKLWAYLLVAYVVEIVMLVIAATGLHLFVLLDPAQSQGMQEKVQDLLTAPSAVISAIAIIILLVLVFWSSLAILVKRLHDRNRRAIWLVYFLFGPLLFEAIGAGAGYAIRFALGQSAFIVLAELPFLLLAVALFFWGFAELYFLRGTVGDNRFGPDPLNKG